MCGIRIEAEGSRVIRISGDDHDPLSRGYICPKAAALKELHEDPDRLRTPMRRTGSEWKALSWEAAFDEVAERLHRIQADHGRDAMGFYIGNPVAHNTGLLLMGPMFLRLVRTKNRFSATSVDQLPHMLTAFWMFGHQLLLPIPDVDRTDYFLVLGANPLASNGSLMSAPGMRHRLEALRARGGKVVVVDPRRTETAAAADRHLFVRPGTDALLLAALLREVLKGGANMGRLADFTDGLELLRAAVAPFDVELAAHHTGIAADEIRTLARELLAARTAAVYGRVGTSMHAFGGLCQWLINALNIVTGNLDRPGGVMFPLPALDPLTLPRGVGLGRGSFGRFKSRVRGLPEFGGELPVAALAEDILTEGEGRIRGLVTLAGNPVLSTPNGKQVDKALASLDFMVSIDPYLNETTRHAHIILPPPTPLERSHYDVVFHLLAVRNTARYGAPLFPKPEGAFHDWQILLELGERIEAHRDGKKKLGTWLKYAALGRLGVEGMLELGLRAGPYGIRKGLEGVSLKKLKATDHGLDFGPLQPALPGRLFHRDKRVQLAPKGMVEDLPRLLAAFSRPSATLSSDERKPLLLVGRRHTRDNNSWMHNLPKLVAGKPRCTLMVHPEDARALGLESATEVWVASRVGEIRVPMVLTDEVMPGVVSLPHGYGHNRGGVRMKVATEHAGASINDLTDELALDALCGTAAFSGVPVTLRSAV